MSSDGAVGVEVCCGGRCRAGAMPTLTYPALYEAADAASLAGQQAYKWLVMADLGLLGTAGHRFRQSGCSAVGGELESGHRRRVAGDRLRRQVRQPQQRGYDALWFDGRAVAETVKSATWRYAMGARLLVGVERADAAFVALLRETMQARASMPHLHHLPTESRQMPKGWTMSAPRRWRRGGRCTWRSGAEPGDMVRQQGRRPTPAPPAAGSGRAWRRNWPRWWWPSPSSCRPDALDVVAVFTTFAAAIAAWTQFRRHDELSKSYSLAAHELAFLRAEVEDAGNERTFRKAVDDTESAISREHTMWMAKRG